MKNDQKITIVISLLGLPRQMNRAYRYCQMMIQSLADMDKENQYILLLSKNNKNVTMVNQNNFTPFICRFHSRYRWILTFYEEYLLKRIFKQKHGNVLYNLCRTMSMGLPSPKVLKMDHTDFFNKSENWSKTKKNYVRMKIKKVAKKADAILVLSDHSFQVLSEEISIPEEKIMITYAAITELCLRKKEVLVNPMTDQLKEIFAIQKPYFLSIGSVSASKQMKTVLMALKQYKDDHSILPFQFIIAGTYQSSDSYYRTLKKYMKKNDLNEDVIFIQHPSDLILGQLLAQSHCLINSSIKTKFALTIIEAFYYDIPVLCSDNKSFFEVGDDACLYFAPNSVEDLSRGMEKIWNDQSVRVQMLRRGKQRIALFDKTTEFQKVHNLLIDLAQSV